MWPDIYGLRPAFRQMGRRLAESGYSVLVVNPFYRTKRAPPLRSTPISRIRPHAPPSWRRRGPLTAETAVTDAKAFVAWLDGQSSVDRKRKMGTSGYCMTGPFTMRTAAALPDRIGAGLAFTAAVW